PGARGLEQPPPPVGGGAASGSPGPLGRPGALAAHRRHGLYNDEPRFGGGPPGGGGGGSRPVGGAGLRPPGGGALAPARGLPGVLRPVRLPWAAAQGRPAAGRPYRSEG